MEKSTENGLTVARRGIRMCHRSLLNFMATYLFFKMASFRHLGSI